MLTAQEVKNASANVEESPAKDLFFLRASVKLIHKKTSTVVDATVADLNTGTVFVGMQFYPSSDFEIAK